MVWEPLLLIAEHVGLVLAPAGAAALVAVRRGWTNAVDLIALALVATGAVAYGAWWVYLVDPDVGAVYGWVVLLGSALVALPRARRVPPYERVDLGVWLLVAGATTAVWCLLIFGPRLTSLHQGSYLTVLLVVAASVGALACYSARLAVLIVLLYIALGALPYVPVLDASPVLAQDPDVHWVAAAASVAGFLACCALPRIARRIDGPGGELAHLGTDLRPSAVRPLVSDHTAHGASALDVRTTHLGGTP